MSIKFSRVRAGEYVADVPVIDGTYLHIEVDRIDEASGYLDWSVFISRRSGDIDSGMTIENVYTIYAQTLREAKALASDFAEAEVIFVNAMALA